MTPAIDGCFRAGAYLICRPADQVPVGTGRRSENFHDVVMKSHDVVMKCHDVVMKLHDVVMKSHDVVMKLHDVVIKITTS